MKYKSLWAKLALLFATLIWGSSFFVMKETVELLPPMYLLAVRFSLGTLALALLAGPKYRLWNRAYLLHGFLLGVFLFLAYAFQTVGITGTTPGKNAFLTAVYCVLVPFLSWVVDRRRPDRYHVMAALCCIVGIGLVSLTQRFTMGLGDTLTLLGGLFYAFQMVFMARFTGGKDPVLLTLVEFVTAGALCWISSLLLETQPPISGDMWGTLLYLSFICSGLALLLQSFGQKYTDPSSASLILSLESVFGVAFSLAFYGERPTLRMYLGFALILLAVVISETKLSFLRRKRPEIA